MLRCLPALLRFGLDVLPLFREPAQAVDVAAVNKLNARILERTIFIPHQCEPALKNRMRQ